MYNRPGKCKTSAQLASYRAAARPSADPPLGEVHSTAAHNFDVDVRTVQVNFENPEIDLNILGIYIYIYIY